jgi:hypothetical protein
MSKLREMSGLWFSENAAQEIEKDVNDWLSSERIPRAKQKWLWELLQNALDAAIASGQKQLEIGLSQVNGDLLFKHDGAGGEFSQEEFFRLLTRGTSKRQAGSESEGRFGEGFAVTHVLSRIVKVSGVEHRDDEYRRFMVTIDRTGSWQQIADCIGRVIDSVDGLTPSEKQEKGFAEFRYIDLDERAHEALQRGLCDQQSLIPYVLSLASVRYDIAVKFHVATEQLQADYEVTDGSVARLSDFVSQVRVLEHPRGGSSIAHDLLMHATAAKGHYLVVPVHTETREVVLPRPDEEWPVPRLFTAFPLLKTSDVPLRCIVAGTLGTASTSGWRVDKDRFDFNYEDQQAADILKADIGRIPQFWRWLMENDYANAHRVLGIGDTKREVGTKWWHGVLREMAGGLCAAPSVAVDTPAARWCKASEVMFPALPGDANSSHDAAQADSVHDVWELCKMAGHIVPAEAHLLDWYVIARDWSELGAPVRRLDIRQVSEAVGRHENINDLATSDVLHSLSPDAVGEFLGRLVQAHASYVAKVGSTPDFVSDARVYCSQSGQLHVASDGLRIDNGVSEDLKGVASGLDSGLRQVLLIQAQSSGDRADWCLRRMAMKAWAESDALRHVLDSLADNAAAQHSPGSLLGLLLYLFRHQRDSATMAAVGDWHAIPVVTSDGSTETLTKRRQLRVLAPRGMLKPTLNKHVALYPGGLILADSYAESVRAEDREAFASFLVEKRIASADGFFDEAVSLDQGDVRALSVVALPDPHSFESVLLRDVVGLQTLLSAAAGSKNRDTITNTLRFVLEYVVTDERWQFRTPVDAPCSTHRGAHCDVTLWPAKWLARVKETAWIMNEREEFENPNRHNLEGLLGSVRDALAKPQACVLLELLGCDRLDLAVARFSDSKEARQAARDALAAIATGAHSLTDLEAIRRLWSEHEDRRNLVNSNHALGEIVQIAIAHVLKKRQVAVWGDHIKNLPEHDLKVLGRLADADADIEDILIQLCPASPQGVWVEVKTASTSEVKMTEPQARAAVDRCDGGYVLCVVDFRERGTLRQEVVAAAQEASLDKEAFSLRAADLAPRLVDCIRVSRVGAAIRPKLTQYVDTGQPDADTGVRVEAGGSPRFVIPASLWSGDTALMLDAWVGSLPEVGLAQSK